jgi:hypothetical protein
VAEVIAGPARDWLEASRGALNGRFRLAQRRFPKLDLQAVLALIAELLPPLAGEGEDGSADLLSSAYDLILLHAGRGTLAPAPGGGGSHAGISFLLRHTFPRLRHLLLARPGFLPAALSNATENLGRGGADFAREIAGIAGFLRNAGDLLEAGTVLAWRLGEARLRGKALEMAPRLPPRAALSALGLPDWPETAAPLAVSALAADAWRHPQRLFTPETLGHLEREAPEKRETLEQALAASPAAPLSEWTLAGRPGDFAGFDGHFAEPPLLLKCGDPCSRYRFWVRSGEAHSRIDADAFGWVSRPDPLADFPAAEISARPGRLASLISGKKESREARLFPDGTFERGGDSVSFPYAKRATSFVARDDFLAFTLADSFRVRVLAPSWRPL